MLGVIFWLPIDITTSPTAKIFVRLRQNPRRSTTSSSTKPTVQYLPYIFDRNDAIKRYYLGYERRSFYAINKSVGQLKAETMNRKIL